MRARPKLATPALMTNAEAVSATGLTRGQLRHRVRYGRLRVVQPFPRTRWRYFAEEIVALAEQLDTPWGTP